MTNYIYVIASSETGPCKIGRSSDPDRRLKQLQTGHAVKLRVFYREEITDNLVSKMERIIHKAIGIKRMSGEWFSITPHDAILELRHAIILYEESLLSARERLVNLGTAIQK